MNKRCPHHMGFLSQHVGLTHTVYPKKYAHGFGFAVLCCGYTLTDFPISIRLTSLALWQSTDCPSASKATLMNMDKYFMWIHYERLHNHNKAKHNKTVCIFLGIYCTYVNEVTRICPANGLLPMEHLVITCISASLSIISLGTQFSEIRFTIWKSSPNTFPDVVRKFLFFCIDMLRYYMCFTSSFVFYFHWRLLCQQNGRSNLKM